MNIRKYYCVLAVTLLAFIQGCASPKYETFYDFQPPQTSEGRACIFQCENTKMQCEQLDQMRIANCGDRADIDFQRCTDRAKAEYDRCKASGKQYCAEARCEKTTCSSSGQCDTQYQRCYTTCGGKVTSETRCVANCEK